MKTAALVLGILGGVLGMAVGFFVYGYIAFVDWFGTTVEAGVLDQADNPERLKLIGVIAPILAIAGGAMAQMRPLWAAGCLVLATAGMAWAFGFGLFTVFPIAMTGLAALFALLGRAAREPGSL